MNARTSSLRVKFSESCSSEDRELEFPVTRSSCEFETSPAVAWAWRSVVQAQARILVERDVHDAATKRRRARARMVRHPRGFFKRLAVFPIGREQPKRG
jgi:hypothetical protein